MVQLRFRLREGGVGREYHHDVVVPFLPPSSTVIKDGDWEQRMPETEGQMHLLDVDDGFLTLFLYGRSGSLAGWKEGAGRAAFEGRQQWTEGKGEVNRAIEAMHRLAENAGDVEEWNEGGYAYEAIQSLRGLEKRLG